MWLADRDPQNRSRRLVTGADLEVFTGLLERRMPWLSEGERRYIEAVREAESRRRRREQSKTRSLEALVALSFLAILFAVSNYMTAQEVRDAALQAAKVAVSNESRALVALSEVAADQHRYVDAVKLALAAWPRSADDARPKLLAAIRAPGQAQRFQRQTIPTLHHEKALLGAAFNSDETRILSWSEDGTARLWDISRLPAGHSIDVACGMLPDHTTDELKTRYGIAITEPICARDTSAPFWAQLEQ